MDKEKQGKHEEQHQQHQNQHPAALNQSIHQQLEEELSALTFQQYAEVRQRTHPVTFKQKLLALWNKEISVKQAFVICLSVIVILIIPVTSAGLDPKPMIANEQEKVSDKIVVYNGYWYREQILQQRREQLRVQLDH